MRALLITVALLLTAPAAAQAQGLGSLQDASGKWGSRVMCSTGYDSAGEAIVETCRTLNYCRMRVVKHRLRVGRCVKVAPWQRGTRTYQSTEPPKSTR